MSVSGNHGRWFWFGLGANTGAIALTCAYLVFGSLAMWLMVLYTGFTLYKWYKGRQEAKANVSYTYMMDPESSSDSGIQSSLHGTVDTNYDAELWDDVTEQL
jgi:hypothetical protein